MINLNRSKKLFVRFSVAATLLISTSCSEETNIDEVAETETEEVLSFEINQELSTNISSSTNLALGKTTQQSSTGYGGVSSRAVDGNTAGNWSSGTTTHTNNEYQPWWQVRLGADYTINQIVIYNRTDSCCKSRLSNFDVFVYNDAGVQAYKTTISSLSDSSITIDTDGVVGARVRIKLKGTNPLSLAEVQVYGESGGSSDFISTNDGTFELNNYQIESSSHNSSSSDKSTDSYDYDNAPSSFDNWYWTSGGDYYLKSDTEDGKRTEWKEESGQESSLNTSKTMIYEASISDIPEHGVTIAQMHNRFKDSDDYKTRRPLLRVYIEDGKVHVKKTSNDLTNTSGTYDDATEGPSVSEGEKFKVQLTTGSGKVNVKVETSSGTIDEDYYPYTDGSYSDYENDFYFKAGVYTEGDDTNPVIRFYSFEN